MACYHPLTAYRGREVGPSGKRRIVFKESLALGGTDCTKFQLPCGQCIGCRLEHSRQWAIRCVHEAQMHEDNCFITLTYDDLHLPYDGSLDVVHFQLFMKRLRKKFSFRKIRYFHCGEYGDKFSRPHYHACLFNMDFEDKILWQERDDVKLYVSEILTDVWGHGFTTIGDVTFESAAYVARYITKKVTGINAATHYEAVIEETGEIVYLKPEYTTMSRRPGIAKSWFDKFGSDVYPSDEVILRGKKIKPPKYYDKLYDLDNSENCTMLKELRKKNARSYMKDNTPARLAVREEVKNAQFYQLKRKFEG